MRKTLIKILAALSRRILAKYQPMIVGITGSVGKTSSKEAVYRAFAEGFGLTAVRASAKNYNNEFGLPLTIIGADAPGRNPGKWLSLIFKALVMLYAWEENYPKVLILEMGVDRPGDMDFLISIAKPNIAILTSIGLSHLQYFNSPEAILREKSKIFRELGENDFAILNYDDQRVLSLQDKLHAQTKILSYGLQPGAKIRVDSYAVSEQELQMQISYKGETYKLELKNTLGLTHVLACAAGFAAGVAAGISSEKIIAGLQNYQAESGRLKVVPAIGKSIIIDDSYNAAPASMQVALQELLAYPADQKIAALGDMLELGPMSQVSHRAVGDALAEMLEKKQLQYAILVGEQMRTAVEQIEKSGYNIQQPEQRIFYFENSAQAAKKARQLVEECGKDTVAAILVKGSQGARMERVARELIADKSRAEELLVRQSPDWLRRK